MNLEDAIYNSLLWTPGKVAAKGSATLGEVMFKNGHVYSTDGHVFLRVSITDPLGDGWIDGAELKGFTNTEQLLKLNSRPAGDARFWKGVPELLSNWDQTRSAWPFAISPERFSKFSLLRPRNAYPVDFTHAFTENAEAMMAFRYGPDVVGVLAPLDREHLDEVYRDEPGVLW